VATKPWRFAPVRRTAAAALVVVLGAGAGIGAVALTQGGSGRPGRRPPTPSVAAFPVPAHGVIQPISNTTPVESFAEPDSARAALETFLGAERDGVTARSYDLLTNADQQEVGSPAAWAASSEDRVRPVTFTVTSDSATADGADVTADVTRRPSLDQFSGFVSARVVQIWHVVRQGTTWRVSAQALSESPVLPPVATAADVAARWVGASAACDRAAATSLEGVPQLTGPQDLLGAPCHERGAWTVTGAPMTFDRAPDVQAFIEAYGPDVGTWARLVPVRGPTTHFLAAVAPLGDGWRVIGVATDGG